MKTTVFAMGCALILWIAARAIRVPEPERPQPRPTPQQPIRHYRPLSPEYLRARRYVRKYFKQSGLPFEAVSFIAAPNVPAALSLGKYKEVQKMTRIVTENLGLCECCTSCAALPDMLHFEMSAPCFATHSEMVSKHMIDGVGLYEVDITLSSLPALLCGSSPFGSGHMWVQCSKDETGKRVITYSADMAGSGENWTYFYSSGIIEVEEFPISIYAEIPVTGQDTESCPDAATCASQPMIISITE